MSDDQNQAPSAPAPAPPTAPPAPAAPTPPAPAEPPPACPPTAEQLHASVQDLELRLADIQAARVRDMAIIASGRPNTRANVLAIGAAVGMVACLVAAYFLTSKTQELNSSTGGLIIGIVVTVASTFGNALLSVYNFEFGSSRGSSDKSNQMSTIATEMLSQLGSGAKDAPTSNSNSTVVVNPPPAPPKKA